ncbi:MAG TPA: hypothetical protein VFS43_04715 [Polyangiaceae bacterium]|nr:hypothetical protein [Polyangiaceae bacterium]
MAVTLGLGATLAGCVDAADLGDKGASSAAGPIGHAPRAEGAVAIGSGSSGNNGLGDGEYFANQARLLAGTNVPLFLNGELNVTVAQLFTVTPASAKTFGYAMQCALPYAQLVNIDGVNYKGGGILKTVDAWLAGPLDKTAKEDLFACMATLVNPFEVPVTIRLTGPTVDDKFLRTYDPSLYTFREALWKAEIVATMGAPPTVKYRVWPLPDLEEFCPAASAALETRLCGAHPELCDFIPGGPIDQECVQVPEGYECGGKPVIQSWLRPNDVDRLYPTCP